MFKYMMTAAVLACAPMAAFGGTTTTVAETNTNHVCQLHFNGSIERGDQWTFISELQALDAACEENVLVVIETPGGDRETTVDMYHAIVEADADTMVTTYAMSGGAIMWMAGDTRFKSEDAEIGFHFAYTPAHDDIIDIQLTDILVNYPEFFKQMGYQERKEFVDQMRRDISQSLTIDNAWEDMKFYAEHVYLLDTFEFIDRLVAEGVGSFWFLLVDRDLAENVLGNVVYLEDIPTVEEETDAVEETVATENSDVADSSNE